MQLSIDAACNLALQRIKEGKLRDAEQLCHEILKAAPRHARGRHMLAVVLSEQEQYDRAIALLEGLLSERPNEPEYLSHFGNAVAKRGQVDQGIDILDRTLRLAPDSPTALRHLNEAIQLKMLAVSWAASKPSDSQPRLPYLGDRVVLLRCDAQTRHTLRPMGLHGGCQFDPTDGANAWLNILLASGDEPARLEERARRWIDWLRDEAAMIGATATVWSPRLPESFAEIVRRIAGADLIEVSGSSPAEIQAKLAVFAIEPPPTAGKIFAVVSIRNGGVELLPHWLEHYTKLGADELLLGVFSDLSEPVQRELDRCARRWKFRVFPQQWEDAVESEQYCQRRTACRKAGALPDTWIVHTDLDEFQEYPAPLRAVADDAERKGIRAILGSLSDRVAEDGGFHAVRPSPSLWEQFPVECKLTERISGGQIEKVMLARFSVPVTVGHHVPFIDRAAALVGSAGEYRVAHFKWHGEAMSRLRWALQRPNAHTVWKSETERLLKWLDKSNGRIDLDDPALEAKKRAACI